jgi:DNA polymerase elongation subunit (family B)
MKKTEGEKFQLLEQVIEKAKNPRYKFNNAPDPEMVTEKVELCIDYVNFLKDYQATFGFKEPFDEFLMRLIYDRAEQLFQDLHDFARKKGSMVPSGAMFHRWPHMAIKRLANRNRTVNRITG